MTTARRDGLYLLLLGSAMFLVLGTALERISSVSMIDFKVVYYSARSLVHHRDPYSESQVLRVYQANGGGRPEESTRDRQVITRFMYLPTAFSFTIPFAILGFGPAHLLWMTLLAGSSVASAYLLWDIGAEYAPVLSGALIGFLLANSELQMIDGNASGISISFCVIAIWCFFKDRLAPLGVLCLAAGMALKPHDTGLVWLYFLLAGGTYRKRAMQTLAVFAAWNLPVMLWVAHVSPHWIQEFRLNLAAFSVPGGLNDPSPASSGAHGIGMMINLQTALSFFRNDSSFYNPAAYVLCGVLLAVWLFAVVGARFTPRRTWLALAAVAPLSLLPMYHRQGDATLLLLTVPACAMLWAEGGPMARLGLLLTGAGFVLTGDLSWAMVFAIMRSVHLPANGIFAQAWTAAQVLPVPFILLAVSIFYLWVSLQRAGPGRSENGEYAEVSASAGATAVQRLVDSAEG